MGRSPSILLVAAILIGSLAAAGYMISMRPEPERGELPSQVPFAITEPVVAGAGAIPVRVAGTVRARAEVEIAAEVGGRVVWVEPAFQSGGRIREGQPILRIDNADYHNRVEQVRSDIAAQQVEILRVEEEARLARAQYEEFRRRQADAAPAEEAGPLTFWQPQLDAARAVLDRHNAVLAAAELALSRTEVRAPFDGVVRVESLEVGQYVAPGQGVGRLYASDAVEVVAPLPDASAALVPGLWDLRAGQSERRIRVRVVAEFGKRQYAWAGHADRVETALDEQTRTLDLIVRVPEPFAPGVPVDALDDGAHGVPGGADSPRGGGPPLLLGMFVDVEIEGIAPESYFNVRRAALRPGDEVWVVRGGRVTLVPVDVLQHADEQVLLRGALQDGDAAVVGGLPVATEGMQVQTAPGEGR